ncbi:hypothetical protein PENTCL1PPCAC_29726 [Pristionchus entomophagus]|uniref:Neurotransmitter-gated ion-channel ligand-binding domain-containing protein n=1 Tax=Pristionchus entomophagus TaxID=358040 RepID=A0AAV5UKQ2_9BILA|nr:hypothetical protein PENTCL1PPCAC_29726 [Pristionchus entomophagus]
MSTSLQIICVSLLFGSAMTATDFDLSDVMKLAGLVEVGEETAIRDSKITFEDETKLLYKVAATYKTATNNRQNVPAGEGGYALTMTTSFDIEHVEPLNEDEETMTVHGSVILRWKDPQYTWSPEDYHQVKAISRSFNDYTPSTRPWTPKISFRTADPADKRRAESAEGLSTILTTKYNGEIAMLKKFSVKAPCNFDFRDFPYDTQRCTLILSSQNNVKEVWFKYDGQEKHSVRQLKTEDGSPSPMIGDFVLDFIHVFNALVTNDERPEQIKEPPKVGDRIQFKNTQKVVAIVNLSFNRLSEKYFYLFTLPLISCVLIAQGAIFFDTKKGFFVLGIAFLLLVLQMSLIQQNFPSDADGTPLLVVFHYLAFLHVIVCFVGLVLLTRFFGPREGLVLNGKPAPPTYYVIETAARIVYFIITYLLLFIVCVGSLNFGAWHHWESDD